MKITPTIRWAIWRPTPRGPVRRTYSYDNRNREVQSTWNDSTPAILRTYDVAGWLLTLDNGVSCLTYTYDDANELLSETQDIGCAGAMPAVVSYSYDADGNRATLTYPDSTVVTYGYTGRNQLATVTAGSPPPLATYSYDATGNRIGKTSASRGHQLRGVTS